MFKIRPILALAALLAGSVPSFAQLNDGGSLPVTLSQARAWGQIPTARIAKPNLAQILREDQAAEAKGGFARYGRVLPTQINHQTHGEWQLLPNGDRLWRLRIEAQDAQGIALYFDHYKLEEGAKMHVYNDDKSQILGGFGAHNNHKLGVFATAAIAGEAVTVEYYEPAHVRSVEPSFQINGIGYAYKFGKKEAKEFGDATSCHVNVACSEINGREAQRDAVARVGVVCNGSMGWCSGSMVNNTAQDATPYFLTAMHCMLDGATQTTAAEFAQWTFDFDYQSLSCSNPFLEPIPVTRTGATRIADSDDDGGNFGSDFLLLQLDNMPPAGTYYAGWNRNNTPPVNGYGIHHPAGDIKKISSFSSSTSSSWGNVPGTHWSLDWIATTNGHSVTMGGSSGSPIFNANGLLVGTLTGGSSDCDGSSYNDAYGKMFYHWTSNGSSNARRLQPWLDPTGSSATTLQGAYMEDLLTSVSRNSSPAEQFTMFPNPNKGILNINIPSENVDYQLVITDALGRMVKTQQLNQGQAYAQIAISDLANGVYFVSLQSDNAQYSQKLILQK